MGRRPLYAATLLAALCTIAGSSGSVRAAPASVHVWVAQLSPLRIEGRGFLPGKRVRVEVTWKTGRVASSRRVTPQGRFAVSFPFSAMRLVCRGMAVTAKEPDGPRARLVPRGKRCGAIVAPAG